MRQQEQIHKGLRPAARSSTVITHLFFADDIAVFGLATPDTCRSVREVLLEYCRLSGQAIN